MEKWCEEFEESSLKDKNNPDLTPDQEVDQFFEILTYSGCTIRNYKSKKRIHEITIREPRFELFNIKLEGKNDVTIDLKPYVLRGVQEPSDGVLFFNVIVDDKVKEFNSV